MEPWRKGKAAHLGWNNVNFQPALGNADLSWLQPLGREPSEEPFCEHEEQDDFRGVGCHMFTPCSISSSATVNKQEEAG